MSIKEPIYFKGAKIELNYSAQMPYAEKAIVEENFKLMPEEYFENFMKLIRPGIAFPQDLELEKAYQDAAEYEFWIIFSSIRREEMKSRGLNPDSASDLSSFEAWKKDYQLKRPVQNAPDSMLLAQGLLNDIVLDVRMDLETRYRNLTKMPNQEDEFKRASMLRLLLDQGEYFIAAKFIEALETAEPDIKKALTPGPPAAPSVSTKSMSGFGAYQTPHGNPGILPFYKKSTFR